MISRFFDLLNVYPGQLSLHDIMVEESLHKIKTKHFIALYGSEYINNYQIGTLTTYSYL
jgi:hypothetical protein